MDQEIIPELPLKAIKLKAVEYIFKMKDGGVSMKYAKYAAMVMARNEKELFLFKFQGSREKRNYYIQCFDLLIKGIDDYL